MRRLFKRVGAFYEKHQVAIDLALITAGAAAVKRRLEAIHTRLGDLEERGLVPLDDLVTVRDVAKIDRRVWVLEGEPGPDPAAVFEDPHDQPCPHGDDVGCCLVCTPVAPQAEGEPAAAEPPGVE